MLRAAGASHTCVLHENLILSRHTVRTCAARCAPEIWRKLFSLVARAKYCFLQVRVPNIKCGESWRDQNKHGRDLRRTMFSRLLSLFLQCSVLYGSSDQSVHNYGSRTTTFLDCPRHFVRTFTHAFGAQALTVEMYEARICIAGNPLSAQSVAYEQLSLKLPIIVRMS